MIKGLREREREKNQFTESYTSWKVACSAKRNLYNYI